MVRLQREFGRPGQREDVADAEIGFGKSGRDENDRVIATLKVEESERRRR